MDNPRYNCSAKTSLQSLYGNVNGERLRIKSAPCFSSLDKPYAEPITKSSSLLSIETFLHWMFNNCQQECILHLYEGIMVRSVI